MFTLLVKIFVFIACGVLSIGGVHANDSILVNRIVEIFNPPGSSPPVERLVIVSYDNTNGEVIFNPPLENPTTADQGRDRSLLLQDRQKNGRIHM